MPATVYLYNNNDYSKRLGQTSKAFNCVIDKELMREHTLQFEITNDNPFFKMLFFAPDSDAFECDGQIFDVTSIDTDSGESNITHVTAEHISYRLSDYMVPDNYSVVGTLPQIVADILEQGVNIKDEKASAMFSVGNCYDGLGNVTYALIGQNNITVRAALLGLTYLGVEVDFDNFKIHCPLRVGSDKGVVFDFNTNLQRFRRFWDRENGCTYDVTIADSGNIALGDDVTVRDDFIGDETQKRIIAYSKCIDNPTQNSVTLGAFVLDSAAASVETGLAIDTLNDDVSNSVQQGKQYNNVAITHELGFVSTKSDNKIRVIANGTDCFAIQKNVNGSWVTITSVTIDGFTSVSSNNILRVVLNAEECFAIQKNVNGEWVNVTKAEVEGLTSCRLTSPGSQYFGTIGGNVSEDNRGFVIYYKPYNSDNYNPVFVASLTQRKEDNKVMLKSSEDLIVSAPNIIFADEDGNSLSNLHSIAPRGGRILLKNGLVTGVESGGYSGQLSVNGKTLVFTDGCLISVI